MTSLANLQHGQYGWFGPRRLTTIAVTNQLSIIRLPASRTPTLVHSSRITSHPSLGYPNLGIRVRTRRFGFRNRYGTQISNQSGTPPRREGIVSSLSLSHSSPANVLVTMNNDRARRRHAVLPLRELKRIVTEQGARGSGWCLANTLIQLAPTDSPSCH